MRFKAVGNAPIMKQNLYKITASNRFQAVIQFLRKDLAWKLGDPLVRGILFRCNMTLNHALLDGTQFTYINLAFSPAPDDTVLNLYKVLVLPRFGPRDTSVFRVVVDFVGLHCVLTPN